MAGDTGPGAAGAEVVTGAPALSQREGYKVGSVGWLRPLTPAAAIDLIAGQGGWLVPAVVHADLNLFALALCERAGPHWDPLGAVLVGSLRRGGYQQLLGLWAASADVARVLVRAAHVGVIAMGRTSLEWKGLPHPYVELIEGRRRNPPSLSELAAPSTGPPPPSDLPAEAIFLIEQYRYLTEREADVLLQTLAQPYPERAGDRAAAEQHTPAEVVAIARDRLDRARHRHERLRRKTAAGLVDLADDVVLALIADPQLTHASSQRLAQPWWDAAPYPLSERAAAAEALAQRWRSIGVARLAQLAAAYYSDDRHVQVTQTAVAVGTTLRRERPELHVYWRRVHDRVHEGKGLVWPLVLITLAEGLMSEEQRRILYEPWRQLLEQTAG
jgi:hypothetical protein